MRLSHRDHRIDETVRSAFWMMLALVGVVGILAFLAPWTVIGVAALGGLAAVGGIYVVRSEQAISEYVHDLRSVRGGGDVSGWVRFEVGSRVALDRQVGLPARRSPHARPASGRPGPLPPPADPRD